ncbi:MAG TPA: diguanylate cyclase [Acidobacteriaceae bacterium]
MVLASVAASASAQLASPDPGTPDIYQSQIGECQRISMGEPAKASAFAQSFLSKSSLTPYATIMFTDCLAHAKAVANDFKGAVAIESRALQLLDSSHMPEPVQVNIFTNAGGMFQAAGDYERATELFRLALAKSKNLPAAQIAALINMGVLYQEIQSDPLSADPYFHKAFDLTRSLGQEDPYIDFDYGDNLLLLKRYNEALQMMDRIAVLAKDKTIYTGVNDRSNVDRARIFLATGDLKQARRFIKLAYSPTRRENDSDGEVSYRIALSNIHLKEKNPEAALSSAQSALKLGQKLDSKKAQLDAMRLIVSVYSAMNRPAAALAMEQRANAMEVDELKNQKVRNLALYESQLKDQAVQLQNEQLQAEAEIQGLSVKRTRQSRNLLFGILVLLVGGGGAFLLYQRHVGRKLHTLSTTDPLCGILNRREAGRLLSTHRHTPDPINGRRTALFIIDADHFKSVNDKYGHDAGDRVLTELSARFAAVCRPDDLVARWGGEEFLIAAWRLTPPEAAGFAERLRLAAAQPVQLTDRESIPVTVSIGFVLYPFIPTGADGAWREAIYLADRTLYAVKHSGRNAWAGIWGTPQASGIPLRTIHDDPDQAQASGWIEVSSSKPLLWQSDSAEQGMPSAHSEAVQ